MRTWSVEKVRAVERETIEELGVDGLILMENAGFGAFGHALDLVRGRELEGALVVCGPGNNGGDGLVVARHLVLAGVAVDAVLPVDPGDRGSDEFRSNLRAARACGVDLTIRPEPPAGGFEGVLVVDAMLGTGSKGAPRAPFGEWIASINGCSPAVLALDVPSGLDANTGEGPGAIRATRTVTFVAAKPGFFIGDGPRSCGEIVLQEISIPLRLLADEGSGEIP